MTIPVITPGNGSFVAFGGTWTVTAAGVVAFTGVGGPGTSSGVTQATFINGAVWQFNGTNWYGTTTPGSYPLGGTTTAPWSVPVTGLLAGTSYDFEITASNAGGTGPASSPIVTTRTLSGSSSFAVTGPNTILTPGGAVFKGMGMNIYDVDAFNGGAISASNDYLHQVFPRANFLRYTCFDYAGIDAPSSNLDAIVNKWTNNGNGPSVIEFECHLSGPGSLLEGSTLTAWAAWYGSLSGRYKTNQYVWFASQNEPWVDSATVGSALRPDGTTQSNVSTTTAMIWAIYNAVRGAGNTAPFIVMSRAVADPSGITQTYDSDTLTGMKSIVWDLHIYAATSGNSTDLTTAINSIGPYISTLQAFPGGNVPVLCLECGNNTSGPPAPNDGLAGGIIMQAAQTLVNNGSLQCLAEWEWYESGDAGDNDQLVTGGGTGTWSPASLTLTGQGQGLYNWMTTGTPSNLF